MTDQEQNLSAVRVIVDALVGLESNERHRVIGAAMSLLGEEKAEIGASGSSGSRSANSQSDAYDFINSKDPRTKGEEIAVAARFRELNEGAESSSRADIERVIRSARRDFDGNNFKRDADNARRNGFLNSGTGRDSLVLSHYGQKYVDSLPDREEARKLSRPKRATRKKRSASKKKVSN